MKEYNYEGVKLLIIDSFALLFRGYFATAASGNLMQNSKGLYTNGLYQFTRYMLDAIKRFDPTHVVCAFDMGKTTFRNELYSAYKANRDDPPLALVPQFDKLWELAGAFDIPCLGREGFEADDIIGSLAHQYSCKGANVQILTGDGDALQLIDECTEVILLKKGFGNYERVNLCSLNDYSGVGHPYQIIEVKALMGDASDNIPGCPGVGPVTARKLIAAHNSVDGVFAKIDQIGEKLRQKLIDNKAQIYLSRDLAMIRKDIELECTPEQCCYGWNRDKLMVMLEQLELTTIIRGLAG